MVLEGLLQDRAAHLLGDSKTSEMRARGQERAAGPGFAFRPALSDAGPRLEQRAFRGVLIQKEKREKTKVLIVPPR